MNRIWTALTLLPFGVISYSAADLGRRKLLVLTQE